MGSLFIAMGVKIAAMGVIITRLTMTGDSLFVGFIIARDTV